MLVGERSPGAAPSGRNPLDGRSVALPVSEGMQVYEANLRAALARTPISVLGEMRHVAGYVNDIWFFNSSVGQAVAKVRNFPEEDPEQIRTYVVTMDLLRREDFPTPVLLWFEESCDDLDGRQLSVLEHVPGIAATEVESRSARWPGILREFGKLVGRLHSVDLPAQTAWRDDAGAVHDDWLGVVLSSVAEAEDELEARLGDESGTVAVAATTIRERATELLTVIRTPRLVHRDLHLGNVLVDGPQVSAVLDFEMVREWDPAYDFVKIRNSVFAAGPGAKDTFLTGYREMAGTFNRFEERADLYVGLHLLLTVVEYLDGNEGYRDSLPRLKMWLAY